MARPLRDALSRSVCRGLAGMLLGALVATLPAVSVAAATDHVTNCHASGAGSLPAVVAAAGVGDTIIFDQDCTGANAITLTSTITIAQNVTIDATTPPHTIVVDGGCTANCGTANATGGVTVFEITGATVTLNGLTIQDGTATVPTPLSFGHSGGGIANAGTLTLLNSTVRRNFADFVGGGILGGPNLTVVNSIIAQNAAAVTGGGITSDNLLIVTNSTVTGNVSGQGGGIANGGVGTITGSIITQNTLAMFPNALFEPLFGGAGIANLGALTVTTSTISGNTAFGTREPFGGGIYNGNFGQQVPGVNNGLTVTGSTLSGNDANQGGGIFDIGGAVAVADTTITGNTAHASGGGLFLGGGGSGTATAAVVYATITGNTAGTVGGGIDAPNGTVNLTDTIVNANTGGDLNGTPATSSNNLIGIGPGALFAPLGTYGGPTPTIALLPGSPAIDTGRCNPTYTDPTSSATVTVTTDQRNIARPQGGGCDIGAFESGGFTLVISGGNNQSAVINTAFVQPLAVTLTAKNPAEPVGGGVVTFTGPTSGAGIRNSPLTATLAGGTASVTAIANGVAGGYTVIASAAGVTSAAPFSLTNTSSGATLTGITVTAGNAGTTLKAGGMLQLHATGTFSDNTQQDLTGSVTWQPSDPTKATVDASGKVTAVTPGIVAITASMNGVTGNISLTIAAPTPLGITVPSAPASRSSGASGGASPGSGPVPNPVPAGR